MDLSPLMAAARRELNLAGQKVGISCVSGSIRCMLSAAEIVSAVALAIFGVLSSIAARRWDAESWSSSGALLRLALVDLIVGCLELTQFIAVYQIVTDKNTLNSTNPSQSPPPSLHTNTTEPLPKEEFLDTDSECDAPGFGVGTLVPDDKKKPEQMLYLS